MKQILLATCMLFAGIVSAQQNQPELTTIESVKSFSALRIQKGIHVYVTNGEMSSIAVSGNPDKLKVVCNGRRLRIKKALFAPDMDVYITCADLRKIRAEYGAQITCTNMRGENLELLMDENTQVQFSGNVAQLRVVNKNGSLRLSNNYRLEQQLYDYKGNFTDIYVSDDTAQMQSDAETE